MHIGVRGAVDLVHGVKHLARLLRRRGAVEKDQRLPVDRLLEDREILLDACHVEIDG